MTTQKQGEAASPPEQIRGWLTARLPDRWFEGKPEILIDREEITVIGHLPGPGEPSAAGDGEACTKLRPTGLDSVQASRRTDANQ